MKDITPIHTSFYQPDPVEWQTVQAWLFGTLLPWQQENWRYFTQHVATLPHAILFSGNAGTGKRAFTYRLVAWLLCTNKPTPNANNANNPLQNHPQPDEFSPACGHCPSCHWLMSNTHPNLLTIPTILGLDNASLVISNGEGEDNSRKTEKASSHAKKNTLTDTSPTHHSVASIKIDDIRAMADFVHGRSDGLRIVVIHQADSMTLGAANALLKTLEEPAQNVLLFLLSDTPSKLLPTVRSRLQRFNISQMTANQSLAFMQQQLPKNNNYVAQNLAQVNTISGFSPFVAMDMLNRVWYQQRQVWLNSWQAIRAGQRTALQASDFWQKQLSLSDFLFLSQLMLTDIVTLSLQLTPKQSDIDWQKLQPLPPVLALYALHHTIEQIAQDRWQNIQEKLCYDKLLGQMAQI